VSELVVAGASETGIGTVGIAETVGVGVEASATCDTIAAAAGLLACTCCCGAAAACCDGTVSAVGVATADEIGTELIVPIAEETAACVVVGAAAGCSAGAEEGGAADDAGGAGGGASATALVCTAGAAAVVDVDVVTSDGATTAGSDVVRIEVEVAAVRARERVHRRPLTVVIDSCGEAMQATGSIEETPTRAQKRRRRERNPSAAGALSILTWEMKAFCYLMLYIRIAKEDVSWRSKRNRMVVNRWHEEVRLDRPETPHVPGAASSSVQQT
jgi:hypothetical protein